MYKRQPSGLLVGRNRTLAIDVLDYASDGSYDIACGDATGVDNTKLTGVTRSSCTFTVDPIDNLASGLQGDTTFTIPLTSTGGDSTSASFTVNVGPDSTISYSAPSGLKVGRNRSLAIDVLDYASDGSYSVSCGDATGVDNTKLTGVTRSSCTFTVDPIDTLGGSLQGDTTFTVPLTSTGGHTRDATFTVNIGPDSTITYNAPSGLLVGRNRTLEIAVLPHVYEANPSNYVISCGDATGVDNTKLVGVTRSSCTFTVDPIDTLGSSLQGDTTFTVPLTSTGGHTLDAAFTVNIGPDSTITFTAPATSGAGSLQVAKNRTLTVDVSGYASETAGYTVSCGDVVTFDTTELSSVTHTGNSCEFTITPKNVEGSATFNVPYVSTGGHTLGGIVSITVGPDSDISYSEPAGLEVGRSHTLVVDVVASDGSYSVTCGDATGVDTSKFIVTRSTSGDGCSFTVDPVDNLASGDQGDVTFIVPLTSTGGHSRSAPVAVFIGPDSAITYRAPSGLKVGTNRTKVINVLDYASDGTYSVSCGDAAGVDNTKLTGVTHSGSSCTFTVDPVDGLTSGDQGDTTFTIPLTSTGGHTLDASFTVTIGPDSTITYTAPSGLLVGRNRTLEIAVLSHVSEANPANYVISCGDATGVDNTKLVCLLYTSPSPRD